MKHLVYLPKVGKLFKRKMNFLAHAYLSGDNELVLFGNILADSIKGSDISLFPPDMQKGILLHRFIDNYTDNHPTVEKSKLLLRVDFKKYAPVVSDVFYDHFLAKDWNRYHEKSLEEFAANTYSLLNKNEAHLPAKSLNFIPYLIKQNWFLEYRSIEGISLILERMSRRTKFESNMNNAGKELRMNYDEYQSHFDHFFPELMEASSNFSKTI